MGWAVSACNFNLPVPLDARFLSSFVPQSLQCCAIKSFLPPHFGHLSVSFLLGMATNAPLCPSITFRSLTTKSLSIVMLQNACNLFFLASVNFTLTSVIFNFLPPSCSLSSVLEIIGYHKHITNIQHLYFIFNLF